MAVIYMNGFGTLPVVGDILTANPAPSGVSTYSRQAGRYGGYSLRHTNSTSGMSNTLLTRLTFPVPTAEFSLGFALNHRNTFNTTSGDLAGFALTGASVSYNVGFGTGSVNSYSAATSTTAWTIVDGSFTAIGWHWWNFLFRWSSTVGICELYRDGTLLARANGDTVPSGSPPLTGMYLLTGNSNGGAQVDIADMILRDDATQILDTAVLSLFPNGTSAAGLLGSDGDSVSNHLLVNENPTYNAATYVGSATVGATDTYTVDDLPGAAVGTVTAVQASVRAFKDDAGAKTLATLINGTQRAPFDPGGGATVYQVAPDDGGTAWDIARVNAATVGVRVVS